MGVAMTELETQFLVALAKERQGRVGYKLTEFTRIMPFLERLVDEAYIRERRFGNGPGFQITDKGREWVGGLF